MGAFQVLRRLTEGASAELFLARGDASGAPFILEILRPELKAVPEVERRFLGELRARRDATHRNVARRVAAGRTRDGRPYTASEAVDGATLGSELTRGPLSVVEAGVVMMALCDAVEHLHARGWVHGNLKPNAVLVNRVDGMLTPKLIDFGLAHWRSGLTHHPATALVEPEYLSPERIRGQRGDPQSDVYGLGIVLFEALTGFPPFTSKHPLETRRRQLEWPIPPLPGPAAALQTVVERCTEKGPAERYAGIGELKEALEAALLQVPAWRRARAIAEPLPLTRRKRAPQDELTDTEAWPPGFVPLSSEQAADLTSALEQALSTP